MGAVITLRRRARVDDIEKALMGVIDVLVEAEDGEAAAILQAALTGREPAARRLLFTTLRVAMDVARPGGLGA